MPAANRKKTALNGILAALVIIILYGEFIIPTAKLSMYALSSFFIAIITIESGIRASWLFYIVTSLLALIIIPDKIGLVPYFVFFGIYGIVKYYAEKAKKTIIEYALKMIFFNMCLAAGFLTARELLLVNINISFPIWVFIILFESVFLIYDYVFTLFIQYYQAKIRSKLP